MHYNFQITRYWLNAYVVISLFFIVWMLFFDVQNLPLQYSLYKRLQKLKADHTYYAAHIERVKAEQAAHANNDALLEKLAREKYYMKRLKEDLYIIVRD